MPLSGCYYIGTESLSCGQKFSAVNPKTGEFLETEFSEGTDKHAQLAASLAAEAFIDFSQTSAVQRAQFLVLIAEEIFNLGDELLLRAGLETALPRARLENERARTCDQLKLFAEILNEGSWVNAIIDTADSSRKPVAKPDTRSMHSALGPVVVFGASNFPLAFSVAGGDTVSALAAGCPVIVKGHPAHPGTSELVASAIIKALKKTTLPSGAFALIQGSRHLIGESLVKHPDIKAVGFTGSLKAGRALYDLAKSRVEPIPFYGEFGSINPIFALPDGIGTNADKFATDYIASLTLGVGQFCTNPGLLVIQQSKQSEQLLKHLLHKLKKMPSGTMLSINIQTHLNDEVKFLNKQNGVKLLTESVKNTSFAGTNNKIYTVAAQDFVKNAQLQEELFGPVSLIVICSNRLEMMQVATALNGQLTVTIHTMLEDLHYVQQLTNKLSQRAGRVLFNGYPTGVEVCRSMVHGGIYPATTDSRTTSVGSEAIYRFTRQICFQDVPQKILPCALKNNNPLKICRMIDGQFITN
ncbi:MAG: aldehyde dehydrogenase (NADP(+)) [Alcanivoracaceae bacterium]|nr:aldehyde dehydrogenase (NADP(+)) [Alcanivoracaceae bacterium]